MKTNLFLVLFVSAFTLQAQVPGYVPASGLMGYWPFSGNAGDISGNNNNGTVNGASLTSDRFSNASSAYQFNGSGNYISTNYTGILGSGARAVSFWAKTSSTSYQVAVGWGDNQFSPNSGTRFAATFNTMTTGVSIDGADCLVTYSPNVNHLDNNWHHYVYQFNGSTLNQVEIYQDAILLTVISATYNSNSPVNTVNNFDVQFGRIVYPSNYGYFSGSLDDIGIWNRKLSKCEIYELYNAAVPQLSVTGSNTVICNTPQGSATLSASGANTYTWNTGSNSFSVAISPSVTTSYTVTGTNSLTTCNSSVAITVSVTDCTSLKNYSIDQSAVSVFPNPGNGIFRLDLPVSSEYNVTVLNNTGEVVRRIFLSGNSYELDLENTGSGMYFIIVESKDLRVTRKIMKQ